MRWGRFVIPIALVCLILHVTLRLLWAGERVTVFVVGIWPLYAVFQYYILHRCRVSELHSIVVLGAIWGYYVSYHYLHVYEGLKYISSYEMDGLLPEGRQVLLEWLFILMLIIVVWKLARHISSIMAILLLYIGEPVGVIESLRVKLRHTSVNDINRMIIIGYDAMIYLVVCAVLISVVIYVKWNNTKKSGANTENQFSGPVSEYISRMYLHDFKSSSVNRRTYAIDAIALILFITLNCVPIAMRGQYAQRYNTEIEHAKVEIVDDVSSRISKYVESNRIAGRHNIDQQHSYNKIKEKLSVFMPSYRKYYLNTEHDLRCYRAGMFWSDTYRFLSVVICDKKYMKLKTISGGSQYYILVVYDAVQECWRPLFYCDSDHVIRGDSYLNINVDDVGLFD